MSWFNLGDKVVDLASEFITDKDKLNEFKHKYQEMSHEEYLTELKTKTIPWVDALHKMGRQVQTYIVMGMVFGLSIYGIEISPAMAALLGGPAMVYSAVKGKGK